MDFFSWDYVKITVNSTLPTTPEIIKQKIRDVFQTISRSTLCNVRKSFEERVRLCIEEDGHNLQNLFNFNIQVIPIKDS